MGSGHKTIMRKSKDDAYLHLGTSVSVQLSQHKVQERSAIFDGDPVCFFYTSNENLDIVYASFMLMEGFTKFLFLQRE